MVATQPSERAERSRRAILDAACRIFHDRGYAGASLNEIIRASGLTKGGLYFHFPSKEALAIAVVQDSYERWGDAAMEQANQHERAIDRLTAIPRAIAAMEVQEHGLAGQNRLIEELCRDPRLRPAISAPIQQQIALAAALIRQAQSEGDVRADVDPEGIAEIAIGSFLGLRTLTDELGDDAFQGRVETLVATIRAALSPPPQA